MRYWIFNIILWIWSFTNLMSLTDCWRLEDLPVLWKITRPRGWFTSSETIYTYKSDRWRQKEPADDGQSFCAYHGFKLSARSLRIQWVILCKTLVLPTSVASNFWNVIYYWFGRKLVTLLIICKYLFTIATVSIWI